MKKKLLDILDNLEIRELEKVKEMVSESLSCLKSLSLASHLNDLRLRQSARSQPLVQGESEGQ